MDSIQINIWQSFKILWAFLWRGFILTMPIMMVMMAAMSYFIPFPKPGSPPQPPDIKQLPFFFALGPIMIILCFLLQAIALRWALKTKWSDFRLVAVTSSSTEQPPAN